MQHADWCLSLGTSNAHDGFVDDADSLRASERHRPDLSSSWKIMSIAVNYAQALIAGQHNDHFYDQQQWRLMPRFALQTTQ